MRKLARVGEARAGRLADWNAPEPGPAYPQRPCLRERGQGFLVCEKRQRQRRLRRRGRRGWGRGRGRDALPGPSSPVEVQFEGVRRPLQTGTAARRRPWASLPVEEGGVREGAGSGGGTWNLARPTP